MMAFYVRRRSAAGINARGFTLIEIMVAVAVVAILAAIAIPSYSAYVVRGQRGAAKAVLVQTSQAMERYYTQHGSYLTTTGTIPLGVVAGTANCVALSPMNASTASYCISGIPNSPTTGGYTLSATPCGDAAGACSGGPANTSYVDAACDVLSIDNTGVKTVSGTAPVDQCWQH